MAQSVEPLVLEAGYQYTQYIRTVDLLSSLSVRSIILSISSSHRPLAYKDRQNKEKQVSHFFCKIKDWGFVKITSKISESV